MSVRAYKIIEIKTDETPTFKCRQIEAEDDPINAINDHINTIADLLVNIQDKDFITAILRHIKGLKATLRKEVLK